MRRHARPSFAGSIAGTGTGRQLRRAISTLALAALLSVVLSSAASAAPPTAEVGAISEISYTSANVTGTVDPADNPAYWIYQYSTDEVNWSFAGGAEGNIEANAGPTSVPAVITGLKGGTKYFVRLMVFGEATITSSPPNPSLTTLAVAPPTVTSAGAAGLTNTTAELSGSIERDLNLDPAFTTNCGFEYITDAAFQNVNEKQRLTVKATGGNYKLNFDGQETTEIAYNAPAGSVDAALEALSNVGAGAVAVTGGPGSPTGSQPYVINFGGSLAAKNVSQIVLSENKLEPEPKEGEPESGGQAAITTLTEGHAEGFEGAAFQGCDAPNNPIAPGGTSPTPVGAKLTGLQGNTTYHLRLIAANAGGSDEFVATNFKTTAVPLVQTLDAVVQEEAATLAGRVNPFNAPTTYQFEWGLVEGAGDETYENVAPAAPEPLSSETQGPHAATTGISGLLPGTTYHYRIAVTNTQTNEVVRGEDRVFKTRAVAPPPQTCPNESSRTGPSAGLPDCRAYEWVSPGLNGAGFYGFPDPSAAAAADGSAITFLIKDSPLGGEFSTPQNLATTERTPNGWTTVTALAPAMVGPQRKFFGAVTQIASEDRKEWVTWTTGEAPPPALSAGLNGLNGYVNLHQADGTWISISANPTEESIQFLAAPPDFSHIFFGTLATQLPGDPGGTTYEWAEGELRYASVLPNGDVVPGRPAASAALTAVSNDGDSLLFAANGNLYLRVDHKETLEPAASQRTPEDPLPTPEPHAVGVNGDGSKVLFTSKSELTDDANTGENDAGENLYSFDVPSEELTDLTVATDPADAARGADVQSVVGASDDASYVYFVARGKLAKGAISGEPNLYVTHEGKTTFIGPAETLGGVSVTPDGLHAAFTSAEPLTGYDNAGINMVFKYTYGEGIECGSCRPDGSPPTKYASFGSRAAGGLIAGASGRPISDDGSRMFFHTADKLLPGAKNGLQNVYEYAGGKLSLLSPGDTSAPVAFMDASASGDDVFIATNDELVPGEGEGSGTSVYDVRVGAVHATPPPTPCTGENCRGAGTTAPQLATPGTAGFEAPGRLVVPKSKSVGGRKINLRVSVPEAGVLSLSGPGLKAVRKTASAGGFVTLAVALKAGPEQARKNKGVFRSTAALTFTPSSGDPSQASVALKFTAPKKKGGR